MDIIKKLEGAQLTVILAGELNTVTASELEEAIADDLKTISSIVFDMTDLIFITSAGLRILLFSQQELEGRGGVTVCGACREIREVIEVTGFDTILSIE